MQKVNATTECPQIPLIMTTRAKVTEETVHKYRITPLRTSIITV